MDQQLPIERDPLPEAFASLTEAAEFWDTHSTADYEDLMEEVTFEVNLTGKLAYNLAVAKDIVTAPHDVA